MPIPRSVYRAIRSAQPDIHFKCEDQRLRIPAATRTWLVSEIFGNVDVQELKTLISGDAAGYSQPFTKCQVYAIASFTNTSGSLVKIRETRYWPRAPTYQTGSQDATMFTNVGSWQSSAGLGGYASIPNSANNEYWYWPEAGTALECSYAWTLYRPARRQRVRVVRPGRTVTFVYKFNVYLDELRWNMSINDNSSAPGVTRRAVFEITTEQGLVPSGATYEVLHGATSVPGLLHAKLAWKWKYRWAFGNRPSITGSLLPSGITRASFGQAGHSVVARRGQGMAFLPSYAETADDTATVQNLRNRRLVQQVNINPLVEADGDAFIPNVS